MTFGAIGSVPPVKTGQLGSAPQPCFYCFGVVLLSICVTAAALLLDRFVVLARLGLKNH